MTIEADAILLDVLRELGVATTALLGVGGEACVFASGASEVVRIHHPGTCAVAVAERTVLLDDLRPGAARLPFAIPAVLETLVLHGRLVTRERLLPGRALVHVLAELEGEPRDALVVALLDCAQRLGELDVQRPWCGDLYAADPVREPTYHAYLERRAEHSLKLAGDAFASVDARRLVAALPAPSRSGFVHLDLYPGNILVQGASVSAVVDFGAVPIVGDPRLDPLAAAAYLTPFITPSATQRDREVAAAWLRAHSLDHFFEPAQRWLAARWSFARDDVRLHQWCRVVLLGA